MKSLGILTLFLGLASALNHGTYVVIVPKDVRPGVPLNISVNILEATGDVSVTAKLVLRTDQSVVATTTATLRQHVPDTMRLMVPDSLKSGTYDIEVAGTKGLTFTDKTSLHYQSKSLSIFVQTDKAMYKPGQTVHFRAFAIYPNLTVYLGPMDVEIFDPNSNKIKQWLGVKDISGVLTNFMIMDTKPVLGDWKIRIKTHGRTTDKVFTVAEYVLPKFEVTVELPSYSLSSATDIQGTVKAKYTYGKPVKGTVKLRAKLDHWYRPWNYHGSEPMVELSMDINGNAKFTIPMAHFVSSGYSMNNRKIIVEANVTESLTKITLSGSSNVPFYSHAEKIEFLPSNPDTFKPGLSYTAYIKVVQQDDTPLEAATKHTLTVHTTVTANLPDPSPTPLYYYGPRTTNYQLPNHSFTLGDNGIVGALIDIPDNATNVQIRASYGSGITAYKSLDKSYSPSDSYMQLFLQSNNLRAGHDQFAVFRVKSTYAVDQLTYQVMGRGSIALSGSVNGNNATTFTFQVPLNSKMAPNARIVAYYVRKSNGEIVTDSISFDVDGTFENEVSIAFDKTKAQPGEGINVDVTADPTSIVNLLAVDQSVLLLKSGNDITPSEVVDELKTYDTISPSHQDYPVFGFGGGGIGIQPLGRRKRFIWWPYPVYYGGSDARAIFNNVGVKVMTDALVYHHVEQHPIYSTPIALPGMVFPQAALAGGAAINGAFAGTGAGTIASSTGLSSSLQEVEQIRSDFPETWLWLNSSVG